MATLFDLNNVLKLIHDIKPSSAIIVDANVVTSGPDFTFWRTSLENPLFILPCMTKYEKNNKRDQCGFQEEAHIATKDMMHLCHQDHIEDGVFKEGQGWFITVKLPDKTLLESEFEKLDIPVIDFGQVDAGLIILAKELERIVADTPVIFVTADEKIYDTAKFIGIDSQLFQDLPIAGLEDLMVDRDLLFLNWDKVLEDIHQESEKDVIPVEMTLLSKSYEPAKTHRSLNTPASQTIIARGNGILHLSRNFRFTWTLPFVQWDFPSLQIVTFDINSKSKPIIPGENVPKNAPGTAAVEFGHALKDIPPLLLKALTEKITICASPLAYVEDMPTLHDPVSVMKQFFLFELVFQNSGFDGELPKESLEVFENKLRDIQGLQDWASHWLFDRIANSEELTLSRNEFLNAIQSCWNIGTTIKFNIMSETAEDLDTSHRDQESSP